MKILKINIGIILILLICFISVNTFSVLMSMPEEKDVKSDENSVLPPIGTLDCEGCFKALKTGANIWDLELIEYHKRQILGKDKDLEGAEQAIGEE